MIYPIQLISMALFANDGEDAVSAWDAGAEKPYWCLECGASLRLRRGKLKFPHFYHIAASPSCRLYSKSERHLLIQLAIQRKLPRGEAQLEKPFPSIRRIADVVWEAQKIVFEIQCSPISEHEAKERTIEYNSLGYEVVWILDERLFNKRHLSRAEHFIRTHSGYFVGKGNSFTIYDQLEIFQNLQRVKKGEKIPIDLSMVSPVLQVDSSRLVPSQIRERIRCCKYSFGNDWISRLGNPEFDRVLTHWCLVTKIDRKPWVRRYVRDSYFALLNTFLKMSG